LNIQAVEKLCLENEFPHWGLIPLKNPLSIQHYEKWLDQDWHGDMKYLAEHLPMKKSPQQHFPDMHSVLVVTQAYVPHPKPVKIFPGLRLAQYAQGEDYHHWFKNKLKKMAAQLKQNFPEAQFLCFTDSAPVLERDLAFQSGLGWIGKNTCLIDKNRGSLFFIGEIYTSLKLENKIELAADHCGSCNRCIEACPTGAIESPKNLNATKCISYWTIESRKIPPPELRQKIGDWFFGCDICQTVCPWNEKVFGKTAMAPMTAEFLNDDVENDLRWILNQSHREISRRFEAQPLERARPLGLKRNALYVIGNRGLKALRPEVEKLTSDEKLGELAKWALDRLNG
jgi:epoxyqueuosine reductase